MEAATPPSSTFSLHSYDHTVDVDGRDLSAAANTLLQDASLLCGELQHELVEPVHVAFCLFSDLDCAGEEYRDLGRKILVRAGVDHGQILHFLKQELRLATRPAVSSGSPTFSRTYVNWMKEVQYEAELDGRHQLICVDHIAVALALQLQQYGGKVGFAETGIRQAAEKVRGVPDETCLLPEEEALMVDVDGLPLKEAEKEKLDRISPASSAPDSPPESERRDSASSTHEEITEFTTAAQRAADDAYWQTHQGRHWEDDGYDSFSSDSDHTQIYDEGTHWRTGQEIPGNSPVRPAGGSQ